MNMQFSRSVYKSVGIALLTGMVLTGCNDDDDDTPPMSNIQAFDITVLNLTANQPLSPVAALVHADNIQAWQTGAAASVPLEVMAEGGDNSQLIGLDGLIASFSGAGVIGPGSAATMEVSFEESVNPQLTLASMLVNTNDAFTGINSWPLDTLAVGDSWSTSAMAYDAGTERNSESADTVPGPAAGGTGYLAERDDVDRVHLHAGVISADDGLTGSTLDASHRFDNPVIKITITRTE